MDVAFRQKLDRRLIELRTKGVSRGLAAPLLYRLLWRLGCEIQPPLYQDFWSLFLLQGLLFAVLWGLVMLPWLLGVSMVSVIVTLCTGLAYGLFAAIYCRRRAHALGLHDRDQGGTPA